MAKGKETALSPRALWLLGRLHYLHDDHAAYECSFPDHVKDPCGVKVWFHKPRFGARQQPAVFPQSDDEWMAEWDKWNQAVLELVRAGAVSILFFENYDIIEIPVGAIRDSPRRRPSRQERIDSKVRELFIKLSSKEQQRFAKWIKGQFVE